MIQNIVLDLDHTLIVSFTKAQLRNRDVDSSLRYHVFSPYIIFERPRLQHFLVELSKLYDISVWTAASEDYGEFIVRTIIEPYIGKKIKLYYHYDHCVKSMSKKSILKHLDELHALRRKGYTRANTVLVDDNPDVLVQNNYVFHISQFNLDPDDRELDRIFKKITSIDK